MKINKLRPLIIFSIIYFSGLNSCQNSLPTTSVKPTGQTKTLTSDGNPKPYNRPNIISGNSGQSSSYFNPGTTVNPISNSLPRGSATPLSPTASSNPVGQTGSTSDIKERATFNGRVYGPGGIPLDGVIISAKSVDAYVSWDGGEQTTINGAYVFRNAPVGATVEIKVKDGSDTKVRTEVLKSNLQGDPYANVFDFGGSNSFDGNSKLYTIGITSVFGNIYDGENHLINEATVRIDSLDPNYLWFKVLTTRNGTYNFDEVPTGIEMQIRVNVNDKEKIRTKVFTGSVNRLNFGGSGSDRAFAIAALNSFQVAEGVNPFVNTITDHFSTFSIDVDTASYTLMRNSVLNANSLPGRNSVRIEEYLNYFNYEYIKPKSGKFAINTDLATSPFEKDGKKILRIGIQGKEIKVENRKNVALTFLVDTSTSMVGPGKLELVKETLKLLIKQLRPTDTVAIVAFNSDSEIITKHIQVKYENLLIESIDKLKNTGATNVESGLKLAYQVAQGGYNSDTMNRIILCSDGVSNSGVTDPDKIFKMIKAETEGGVSLSTIGFGFDNYNDEMLEKLAVNGDGYYAYVDNIKEALRIFVENATDTLQVIAKDVKIQVDFNKQLVKDFRLLGYENRILSYQDFRNDKVDAGEIGPNHSVTAIYELDLQDNIQDDKLADVSIRFKDVDAQETPVEMSKAINFSELKQDFNQSSPSFKLAAAVALYAEILRGSYWSRDNKLEDVLALAKSVEKDLKDSQKVKEFIEIVEKAISIKNAASTPVGQ